MLELTFRQVQEAILETQEDKTLREMYIHKSSCAEDDIGAVFLAINGVPPKGYAMYLPGKHGKEGALHIFDELGLKRKILHCIIKDLESYKDNDSWIAQEEIPLGRTP